MGQFPGDKTGQRRGERDEFKLIRNASPSDGRHRQDALETLSRVIINIK
jgi:hypothetical protein